MMEKNSNRPLILIANDDGYQAPGIHYLVSFLRDMADILVCAPDGGRSGYACAFSAAQPLLLKPVSVQQFLGREEATAEDKESALGSLSVWACSGTPVDCVKIAYDQFCLGKRLPDLVIGGINHGDNSTVNNHYSGTMGVAMEGCLKYIPSIAFSSCYYDHAANLAPLRPYVRQIVERVLAGGLSKGVCLNVNFPARQQFEGVKVCRMAFGRWVDEVVARKHPRGVDYYWMVGRYQNDEPDAEDTDQWALQHGYVAITPTRMDVTAYDHLEDFRQLIIGN